MSLNSTIIQDAFRESNTIGKGKTPSDAENVEGLSLLQSLTNSFYGSTIGISFKPWWLPVPNFTADEQHRYPAEPGESINPILKPEYPPINRRVIIRSTSPQTVHFQFQPPDGSTMQVVDAGFTADVTLNANGHFFGDTGIATTEVITERYSAGDRNAKRTYVFRADLAAWTQIDDLVLGAENPFPEEFHDYWVTALAMRLSPRYGQDPKQITLMRYKEMLVFCRNWYTQSEETVVGDVGRTEQSYWGGRYLNDPDQGRI